MRTGCDRGQKVKNRPGRADWAKRIIPTHHPTPGPKAVRPDQQKYAQRPMSTRKLIILALLCGIAIVGAFVVQLVMITR